MKISKIKKILPCSKNFISGFYFTKKWTEKIMTLKCDYLFKLFVRSNICLTLNFMKNTNWERHFPHVFDRFLLYLNLPSESKDICWNLLMFTVNFFFWYVRVCSSVCHHIAYLDVFRCVCLCVSVEGICRTTKFLNIVGRVCDR